MSKRIDNAKVFVREHAAEVIGCVLGAAVVCGYGVAIHGMMKKRSSSPLIDIKPIEVNHLDIPEKLAKFGTTVFDDYKGGVEVMADEYTATVSDLGKFGEALCEVTDDISPESKVFVLMNALKNVKED